MAILAPGPVFALSSDAETVGLETSALRVCFAEGGGKFRIVETRGGAVWNSNPWQPRFGQVVLWSEGIRQTLDLTRGKIERRGKTEAVISFHPLAAQPSAALTVTISARRDPRVLEFSYVADAALAVENVRLLDNALWTTVSGYLTLPVREGLMIPADSGLAFTNRFDTYAYEGCHMQMLGVVQGGRAVLMTWDDPYTAVEVRSVLNESTAIPATQVLAPSLVLSQSARAFQLRFLGSGDYVTIGKAYREVARQKGLLVTWKKKLQQHPEDKKLFGAVDFKLWDALMRQMDEKSEKEQSHQIHWTFDEAGMIASHLKDDLKLERVLFMMGGWIRRGYDNQHPDILPAAPECGGDEALARCGRRVMDLGYLFCLHDNYQDIYRDSPSWSEDYVMKKPEGGLVSGGSWAGGRAYLTCSAKALELARRPQNLLAVKQLTGANSYFIDTTYASGLQECFDPKHPLKRQDDIKWKQALSDYAREVFGMFGSECGREWAIPHSDFFEGLTGVEGRSFHDANMPGKVGGIPIPLFEIVYRDTIAMFGKYGFDIGKSTDYVLSHLVIGRPMHYHEVPPHLYWKDGSKDAVKKDGPTADAKDPALFTRADGGWAEGMHPLDRFIKNTYEILSPIHELTAELKMTSHQFLTQDRKVQRSVFGDGKQALAVTVNGGLTNFSCESPLGGRVILPPGGFVAESPEFAAFCALNFRQIQYEAPVLFTLRSLDGKPLKRSKMVRVFHGFGDNRIALPRGEEQVARESVVRR